VVHALMNDPSHFPVVFNGFNSEDPVVRMRAADVVEKVTRHEFGLLKGYEREIIDTISAIEQQEVCWHIALLLPRLSVDKKDREKIVDILRRYLEHESKIVAVNAMQALAELAIQDGRLKEMVAGLIASKMVDGSPAIKARGKKLLKTLG